MSGETISASEARLILGVDAAAGDEALRLAFRAAVKAAHPDRPGGDSERLRLVLEAYRLLSPGAAVRAQPRVRSQGQGPKRLVVTPEDVVLGGWRAVKISDGRAMRLHLPAGLREGERISIDGQVMAVSIAGDAVAAIVGDHLCLTVQVEPGMLRRGGRLVVETPTGPRSLWLTVQDGARGLVRVAGQGLPARGRYARGHLFIRLQAAREERPQTESQDMRARFNAAWAA
jgi:curved DNA-binding protein